MVKRVKIEGSVDRISSLPDSILAHIFSFLPTKVAVSTSILVNGLRWRDIFPFLNDLDFDESLVYSPGRNDPYGRTNRFKDFVDQCTMLMNGMPIHKFRLKCSNAVETSRIHSWICSALCSNVRELDLCIGRRNLGDEYSHVLTCNTLVILKLGAGFSLNVTASIDFSCLKILHLESITLVRQDSLIQRLVSSCPVLEDLLILRCCMEGLLALRLSSPSLKRLTVDKPCDCYLYVLVLDTPSLEYLKFALRNGGHVFENVGSIRDAHVDISYWLYDELLEGLGNVQSLHLYVEVEWFLVKRLDVSEKLPLLKNVTRLVLTNRRDMEMSVVIKFLEYCPNLEEFVLRGSMYGPVECGFTVPCCVPSRLKSIECGLLYIGGTSEHKEVEPLEYFLKNAKMLEKMQIHIQSACSATHRDVIEKLETMMVTMNKLTKAPSRSKTCEINVFLNGERVKYSPSRRGLCQDSDELESNILEGE